MKLTKGMKKALSLLLSGAMVITGVNVTTGTASAAGTSDDTLKWTGIAQTVGDKMVVSSNAQDNTLTVEPYSEDSWANNLYKFTLTDEDLDAFVDPQITVVATAAEKADAFAVCDGDAEWADVIGYSEDAGSEKCDDTKLIPATETTITGALGSARNLIGKVNGRVVVGVFVHEQGVDPLDGVEFEEPGDTTGGSDDSKPTEPVSMTIAMGTVVINGEYELTLQDIEGDGALNYGLIDPADKDNNALANIWNKPGQQEVVAESEDGKAVLSFNANDSIIDFKVDGAVVAIEKVEYNFSVTELDLAGRDKVTVQVSNTFAGTWKDYSSVIDITEIGEYSVIIDDLAESDIEAGIINVGFFSVVGDATETPDVPTEGVKPVSEIEVPDTEMTEGEVPEKGNMEEFAVTFYAGSTTWTTFADLKTSYVKVTGDGTYALTATAAVAGDVGYAWMDTNLHNNSFPEGFTIKAKYFVVGDNAYELDDRDGYFIFADGDPYDGFARVNIINEYNKLGGEDMSPDSGTEKVNGFVASKVPVQEGDEIKVIFTVSGMDKDKETVDFLTKYPDTYPPLEADPTPAPTTTTTTVTTPAAVTPSAISGTESITVKKANRTVLVAAGKSKTIPFTTALDTARGASQAATISAVVTGNTKVNATVTGNNVKIKATKKAVKGSTATVRVTSVNASGAAVQSAAIKVTVQNKVKKVAAKKKSVSLKKGKTAKVVITIKKAENIKKLTTDTVKVTSKVVSLKSAKIAKKKITVTLKGKKKGTKTTTIKIGTQKAKITTKVS